jgi:hypothetical protein
VPHLIGMVEGAHGGKASRGGGLVHAPGGWTGPGLWSGLPRRNTEPA